jgi:hypothetical protein
MANVGAVVVARKSSAPWLEVKADSDASLAKLGYTPTFTSAMGFSGGAATLLGSALTTAGWKRVMLVDPSIPPAMQRAVTGSAPIPGIDPRVEMTYNAANWSGYKAIQAAMQPLATAINRAGGKAVEIKQYHGKFALDALAAMQQRPSDPSIFGAERPSLVPAVVSGANLKRKRKLKQDRGELVAAKKSNRWLWIGGAVLAAVLGFFLLSGGAPAPAPALARANPRRRRHAARRRRR